VDEEESRVRLLSVNVGLPRELEWRGRRVRTSIWKTPAEGRVRVTRLNLEGDEQSDLSVHGGPEKAVYAYPTEHYEYWGREFPGMDLPWGAFGENFTTEGLLPSSSSLSPECLATNSVSGLAEMIWSSASLEAVARVSTSLCCVRVKWVVAILSSSQSETRTTGSAS
jgi:hypothetical protein